MMPVCWRRASCTEAAEAAAATGHGREYIRGTPPGCVIDGVPEKGTRFPLMIRRGSSACCVDY